MTWDDLLDATWPAADTRRIGPMTLRRGPGGGRCVASITTDAPPGPADLQAARAQVRAWGQDMVIRLAEDRADLVAMLDLMGWAALDRSVILTRAIDQIDPSGPMAALPVWPPLAIGEEIWAAQGIDPARRAVMDRVRGPKTALVARLGDRPVGVCFAALHGGHVMVHAMAILPDARRQGAGQGLLRGAAAWGRRIGANTLSMVTLRKNLPVLGLAASLGMRAVGHFHYRQEQPDTGPT